MPLWCGVKRVVSIMVGEVKVAVECSKSPTMKGLGSAVEPVCMYIAHTLITPGAHARSKAKQSVLSVCVSVSFSVFKILG